jgi:hypothetical protein
MRDPIWRTKMQRVIIFFYADTIEMRVWMSRGHHKVFYKCEHAMFFSKTELLNRPVSGLTSFRNWFSFGLDKQTNQFQF